MTQSYVHADEEPSHELLTVEQAAALTPFRTSTLRKWRQSWPDGECRGPRPLRVEGRLFYRRSDVEEWLRAQSEPSAR